MTAQTGTFPLYIMRDADLDDTVVHLRLLDAISNWIEEGTEFEGLTFLNVSAAHDPVQAQLYPELERDGLCAEMRDEDAVMSPAPFIVEYRVLEITATEVPDSMSMALFVGPDTVKAHAAADTMEAIECSMNGGNHVIPSMASIATGHDGATDLVAAVIDSAANHPDTDFGGVDYGGLPEQHVRMVINIG